MHYLSSVYWVTTPLHVSGLLVAHYQELAMYICDNWYVLYVLVDCRQAWMPSRPADSRLRADSHISCRSAKGLGNVFPVWFTQCGRVWFTLPVPFLCHATKMPFWKRILKATAWSWQGGGMGTAWKRHGMCELASAVQRRHVGDLSTFGFFLLPHGVRERL
jgi:hypothetical protein